MNCPWCGSPPVDSAAVESHWSCESWIRGAYRRRSDICEALEALNISAVRARIREWCWALAWAAGRAAIHDAYYRPQSIVLEHVVNYRRLAEAQDEYDDRPLDLYEHTANVLAAIAEELSGIGFSREVDRVR